MSKIKIAVIGMAHSHVTALASAALAYPDDIEIIGFADVPPYDDFQKSQERRRNTLREKGIKQYENWLDLADLKPDLAMVTVDNEAHTEVACELLSRKIHVICEKPMARHAEDAARMLRVAKENGVRVLTNWPIAWFPAFRKAKQLLDEGKIGKLMRVVYRSPATWGPYSYGADGVLPPDEDLKGSWWYQDARGGGSIMDYACYGSVLSTWMFGKQAKRVSGIRKNFCTQFSDVEDYSAMILDFEDGVGLLEGSWTTYNPAEIPTGPVLYGTEGVIVCDRHTTAVKVYLGRTHKPLEPTEVIEAGDVRADISLGANLIGFLRDGKEPDSMLTEQLNYAVTAALDAGRVSADTGVTAATKVYEF